MYKIREFAGLSGVTVKTLHHYDRLGLLRPQRTETGYRIYGASDMERLQQIVALKYLGLSLQQIRVILNQAPLQLRDALRMQRRVLEAKQRSLVRALSAIVEAEKEIRPDEPADIAVLQRLIETITLQDRADILKSYWSEEDWAKLELTLAPIRLGPIELMKSLSRDIAAAAAAGEDPAGEVAQALGERFIELIRSDGNRFRDLMNLFREPEFRASSEKAVADKRNWPEEITSRIEGTGFQQTVPFLGKIMAARPKSSIDFEEFSFLDEKNR